MIENHAPARGYVFHTAPDVAIPAELHLPTNRGLWQTDEQPLPDVAPDHWRLLSGREWLGDYRGDLQESGWPNDPAMPRLLARIADGDPHRPGHELARLFVVRPTPVCFKPV